jgi:hypothetical protein
VTVKDEWPSCVAGGTGEVEALSDVEVPMVARAALEALAGRALVVPSLPGNLGSAGQLLEHYVPLGVEVALEFFRAIKRLGDRLVWIGNKRHDPGVLHLRYQMGMQACSSGQGNFIPEPELEMHEAACRKEWERVIEVQEAVAALERVRDAHDDAAMVKAAMDLIGLKGGRVRPARRNVPTEDWAALASLLSRLEVLRAPSTVKALQRHTSDDLTLPSDKTGIVWAEGVGLVKNLQIAIRDVFAWPPTCMFVMTRIRSISAGPPWSSPARTGKTTSLYPKPNSTSDSSATDISSSAWTFEAQELRRASSGLRQRAFSGVGKMGAAYVINDTTRAHVEIRPCLPRPRRRRYGSNATRKRDKPTSSFGTSFLRSGKCQEL